MNTKFSIIIADEHEVLRRGIKSILEPIVEFEVVGQAATGSDTIDLVQRLRPDVVLLDLILPELDGVEVTRRIKSISPDTNVVVFTSFDDDDHIIQALEAGATSYLLKDVQTDLLIEAIHHAAQGEAVLHPRIATRILQILIEPDPQKRKIASDLTRREVQVLKLVANGMNNQEIAEKLYISISTAKAHVSNILSKLHLTDRTQAAAYAWKTGLMQREM